MNPNRLVALNPRPCGCPSTTDVLRAELAGEPRPLCPTHDADAIAAREADRLRREAQERDDAAVAGMDRLKARWNNEDDARADTARHRDLEHLRTRDPLLAAITVATGADVIPLNAPASAFAALRGMTADTDPTTPFDAA